MGFLCPFPVRDMPQPAAKLVLDKLTFLCIGCKIGNQEEEKPWNHYDLPFATICRRNGKPCSPCWNRPPSPPFAPSSPAVRNCWKRSAPAQSQGEPHQLGAFGWKRLLAGGKVCFDHDFSFLRRRSRCAIRNILWDFCAPFQYEICRNPLQNWYLTN